VKGMTDRGSPRALSRATRARLSLARSHRHGDELRPAVHRSAQDQLESCVRRAGCRNQRGRREDLAGDLHALRSRLLRSRNGARRMRAESLRGTGVTHVSGIKRYPSHRNGQSSDGSPGRIRRRLQVSDVRGRWLRQARRYPQQYPQSPSALWDLTRFPARYGNRRM
jgi:hypothetical protein